MDLCCGRGGGLAFLSKYYEPSEAVGIDNSSHQIATAQDKYSILDNLKYLHGDVEGLSQIADLKGKQFDLVTCIEGYHCL